MLDIAYLLAERDERPVDWSILGCWLVLLAFCLGFWALVIYVIAELA